MYEGYHCAVVVVSIICEAKCYSTGIQIFLLNRLVLKERTVYCSLGQLERLLG
jgi:hypothetical protein